MNRHNEKHHPGFPVKKFWEEVKLIRERHHLFFSVDQFKFIKLQHSVKGYELTISGDAGLSPVVKEEIEFAFQLLSQIPK